MFFFIVYILFLSSYLFDFYYFSYNSFNEYLIGFSFCILLFIILSNFSSVVSDFLLEGRKFIYLVFFNNFLFYLVFQNLVVNLLGFYVSLFEFYFHFFIYFISMVYFSYISNFLSFSFRSLLDQLFFVSFYRVLDFYFINTKFLIKDFIYSLTSILSIENLYKKNFLKFLC